MNTQRSCKTKFPCRLCKGDHLLKYCHGLVLGLEEQSKVSRQDMSSTYGHHVDDPPSTSDSTVKSRKGKVRNPCLLCKDMHLSYLCPRMDEDSKLLEYIIVPNKWLPIGYCKLSLDLPFVDKVVDIVSSLVDPTLSLESEEHIVHTTLPLKIEFKVVESM